MNTNGDVSGETFHVSRTLRRAAITTVVHAARLKKIACELLLAQHYYVPGSWLYG